MLSTKIARLQKFLRESKSVLVALSGGVDSSVLAYVAHEALGSAMEAVCIVSDCFAPEDIACARAVAKQAGFHLHELEIDPLDDMSIRSNPQDRCYICKKRLFARIISLGQSRDIHMVLEGTHDDDSLDDRPGFRALQELGVHSPLLDAGFTKAEIRKLAENFKLPCAARMSEACYLTRFPHGQLITRERIALVREAEAFMHLLGFDLCRVRIHGDMARIEIPSVRIADAVTRHGARIACEFRRMGFRYVAMDLDGYRPADSQAEAPSAHPIPPQKGPA